MTDVPRAYPHRRVNWVAVQKLTSTLMLLGFVFAAGGWFVSIRDKAADLPYLERATHAQEKLTAAVGPNPAATINCLRRKSDAATKAATQATQEVLAVGKSDAKIPNLFQIPACPAAPYQPRQTAQK